VQRYHHVRDRRATEVQRCAHAARGAMHVDQCNRVRGRYPRGYSAATDGHGTRQNRASALQIRGRHITQGYAARDPCGGF
jgi:hypothetical protein